jgi:hypothetical protein
MRELNRYATMRELESYATMRQLDRNATTRNISDNLTVAVIDMLETFHIWESNRTTTTISLINTIVTGAVALAGLAFMVGWYASENNLLHAIHHAGLGGAHSTSVHLEDPMALPRKGPPETVSYCLRWLAMSFAYLLALPLRRIAYILIKLWSEAVWTTYAIGRRVSASLSVLAYALTKLWSGAVWTTYAIGRRVSASLSVLAYALAKLWSGAVWTTYATGRRISTSLSVLAYALTKLWSGTVWTTYAVGRHVSTSLSVLACALTKLWSGVMWSIFAIAGTILTILSSLVRLFLYLSGLFFTGIAHVLTKIWSGMMWPIYSIGRRFSTPQKDFCPSVTVPPSVQQLSLSGMAGCTASPVVIEKSSLYFLIFWWLRASLGLVGTCFTLLMVVAVVGRTLEMKGRPLPPVPLRLVLLSFLGFAAMVSLVLQLGFATPTVVGVLLIPLTIVGGHFMLCGVHWE